MAQLKEDEWPANGEPTTQEQEVARDPINGSKDPDKGQRYQGQRSKGEGQRQDDSGIPEFVDEIP